MQAGRQVRKLVVHRIPKVELDQAFGNNTEPVPFPLLPTMSGYEEWTAVSHTFDIQANGDALITILFEQPATSEAPGESYYMD
jgi:hypothetical protein